MPVSSSDVFLGELRTDDKLRSLASVDEDGPLFAVAEEVVGIAMLTDSTTVEDPSTSLLVEASTARGTSCFL